ncbi:MbeB family mobilization protein, partial [Acinetobacter baretiae]|uniref:MbeB family mobilization protein n=1 Tax=Acinetobacter baretiae TaxID=2605383 RepID=UPI0039A534B1
MSKILDLAKNFEQTSNEQAKNTEKAVSNEFKKHEQRLIDLLNENEQVIKTAVQEQNKRILQTTLKTWGIVALAIIMTLAVAGGALVYQGDRIQSNLDEIATQEARIALLSEKGGKIELQQCIDKKNRKRLCIPMNKDAGAFGNGSLM